MRISKKAFIFDSKLCGFSSRKGYGNFTHSLSLFSTIVNCKLLSIFSSAIDLKFIDNFSPMTAYISVSYAKRKSIQNTLNAITATLKAFAIKPFIFVDKYQFEPTEEKQMMMQAMSDIDNCDILIAETSDKAIGIGIEVGYAKAKNKIVIYLRQKETEHSTPVSGISDFQLIYDDPEDLQLQLFSVLKMIKQGIKAL